MKISKSDEELLNDVAAELAWDTRLSSATIGVSVDNSVVTLTGTLSNYAKKLAAEDAAHRVKGVLDVANDITVQATSERSDTEIAGAIRQILIWDVFVPDQQIQTTVSNGLVTLRGVVETPRQRDHVARLVGNLDGVRGIDNLLAIHPAEVSSTSLRSAIRRALERHGDHEASKIDLEVQGGRVTVSGPVESWGERQAILGAVRGTRGVESVADHLHDV